MRAYLLGFNHGKNDGYFSTLIERGGCEKSYDESLDAEYVAIDAVLEIINRRIVIQEMKYAEANDILHETIAEIRATEAKEIRNEILELWGDKK